MNNAMFSVVTFILVALLLLALVLLLASLHTPKLKKEKLPPCKAREPLTARDRTLLRDLTTIGEKHKIDICAQVGLGAFLTPGNVPMAEEWIKLLRTYYVDFLLCDREKGTPIIAVMQGQGPSSQPRGQAEFVEKTCAGADIPLMLVNDYNLAGLEKALLQKAGLAIAKPKAEEAIQAQAPQEHPAVV